MYIPPSAPSAGLAAPVNMKFKFIGFITSAGGYAVIGADHGTHGTTDASVLIRPLYRRARPEIRDNTRIVAETESAPHMPIAVARWVDDGIARRLRDILLNMSSDSQGHTLLQHFDWSGFVVAQLGDYDSLGLIADQLGVE